MALDRSPRAFSARPKLNGWAAGARFYASTPIDDFSGERFRAARERTL